MRNAIGAACLGSSHRMRIHPALPRGTIIRWRRFGMITRRRRRRDMGGIIYLVGLIVIILFILSFLGLR